MSEPVLRAILVGAVVVAAAAVVLWARYLERRRSVRARLDLSGLTGSVILFSDAGCRTCDQARKALQRAEVAFEEIRYDAHPEVARRVGVTAVPLVVVRDDEGAEVGRIAGRVRRRALRRLLGR